MTTSKLAVIPTISATSETLRALSDALSGLADRVVVVANSESAVRACEAAGVNYIDPQRNAGFGGAVHAACEAENVSDDGWIIIVNDDLDLTDADSRDVKAASSLLDASGAPIVYLLDDTTRRIPTVLDVFLNFSLAARILARLGRHEASLDGAQVPSGHYRSFAFVGISKRAWLSLEGFDTAFTFTYEDADFARRSEFLGRAEVRPIAGVRHLHSVSSSAHVSHVLPVSAWSAYVYLSRTRVPRTIRRVVLTSALLIRLLLIPFSTGPMAPHYLGTLKAMRSVILGQAYPLPDDRPTPSSTRLLASAQMAKQTGIGVVQAKSYPLLAEHFGGLNLAPSRDRHGGNKLARLSGVLVGLFTSTRGADSYLHVAPPLPLFFGKRANLVSIIHDVRWLRTRGVAGRVYRRWDLARTVAKSRTLVCISQRTADDLVKVFPSSRAKTVVVWEGPGLIQNAPSLEEWDEHTKPGRVLLIGGAPHKRNEIAARHLATRRPFWCQTVVSIGVSDECDGVLHDAFGDDYVSLKNVDDATMAQQYLEAEIFLFLGTEEGFGLPYIEALVSGCQVVAIDQPLTRELLGDAGVLIPEGSDLPEASQFVSVERRHERASMFSWSSFAAQIAQLLRG